MSKVVVMDPINPAQNWNYEKNGYRFQGFPYTCK